MSQYSSSYATLSTYNVVGSASYGVQQNLQNLQPQQQVNIIPVYGMNGYETLTQNAPQNESGHFYLANYPK